MGIPRDRYIDRSTVACLSFVKPTPSGAGGVFELHVLECIHDAVRHDEVAISLSIHRHGVPGCLFGAGVGVPSGRENSKATAVSEHPEHSENPHSDLARSDHPSCETTTAGDTGY